MEARKEAALKLKEEGNTLFKEKKFEEAIERYTEGIVIWPANHILRSNRALAALQAGKPYLAYADCIVCINLEPSFEKPYRTLLKAAAEMGDAYHIVTLIEEVHKLKSIKSSSLLNDTIKQAIQTTNDKKQADPSRYKLAEEHGINGTFFKPPQFFRSEIWNSNCDLNFFLHNTSIIPSPEGTTQPPVELKYTPEFGKGLYASRDLMQGEVLFIEKPILLATVRTDACHHCGVPFSLEKKEPTLCENCSSVVYCSKECCDEAAELYHRGMCGLKISHLLELCVTGVSHSSRMPLLILKMWGYCETRRKYYNDPIYWKFWEHPLFNNLISHSPGIVQE